MRRELSWGMREGGGGEGGGNRISDKFVHDNRAWR